MPTSTLALSFLKGGGEMGALIRNHDWTSSSIGTPENWPHSLRIALGIVLNSKFPMFVFWGEDLTCFYNDAYRPSLGNNGKHPQAKGMPGKKVWPEIWKDIKPYIDQVMSGGEGTWSENQLLPIHRNGALEDVYWTFSYSPINDEDGIPQGVFVTCTETTEAIKTSRSLEKSEKHFRNILNQAPDPMLLLKGEDLVLEIANQPLFDLWQVDERALGKPFLEILPEMKEQGFYDMLLEVYFKGITHHGFETPAVFKRKSGKEEVGYFNFVYQPYREADNTISGVLVMASNVTEHVLSKAQLEENEADLFLAVEIAQLGTFRIDIETNTATYSDRIMEWFGLEKNNEKLDVIFSQIHEDERENITKTISATMVSEENAFHDVKYSVIDSKTGKRRILRSIGKTLFNKEGIPQTITGIIQDITKEANTQKRIEESERNLRNIILQAPVAMCLLKGTDLVLEVANERMFEVWGKQPGQMMNLPLFEGLPEAKDQGFEQILQNVLTTGETFSALGVPVNLPRNGKIKTAYINFVYEPYRERNNSISGVMAVAVDVTEQVLAKKKTEIAEERARIAIESAELGVYELNLRTGDLHTNERFNDIFGFDTLADREEIIGRICKDDLPIRNKAHEEALITGNLFYEVRIAIENCLRWIRVRGVIIFEDKKVPVKLLGVVQDITEQKLFAEELKKQVSDKTKDYMEAMEQLVKKNHELEQFAYVASHDLKEPLRMISSYSELLVRRIPKDVEAAEYSRFMKEGVSRMQALINDLLEYSRIGQKPVPPVEVDTKTIVESVAESFHIKIEETGTKIEYANLPKVLGVPSLLSQLFQNLIDNAIKFRKENATPIIKISASKQKDKWLFCVSDNGIGLDLEYSQRIFVIFQRLHTRDVYPGTGIGLSVCKRIVELHGGEIWVDCGDESGASFCFTLPQVNYN